MSQLLDPATTKQKLLVNFLAIVWEFNNMLAVISIWILLKIVTSWPIGLIQQRLISNQYCCGFCECFHYNNILYSLHWHAPRLQYNLFINWDWWERRCWAMRKSPCQTNSLWLYSYDNCNDVLLLNDIQPWLARKNWEHLVYIKNLIGMRASRSLS